jgi:hypothetical protein
VALSTCRYDGSVVSFEGQRQAHAALDLIPPSRFLCRIKALIDPFVPQTPTDLSIYHFYRFVKCNILSLESDGTETGDRRFLKNQYR